jgi:hypothetical protein
MECFNHAGVAGVGVCKACGKAICRTCVIDLGYAVACSETCSKEAAELQEMNNKGKRIYGIGSSKKRLPSGALIYIIMAVVFGGIGIAGSFGGEIQWFMLIMGAMFGIFSVIAYRRAKDIGLQC